MTVTEKSLTEFICAEFGVGESQLQLAVPLFTDGLLDSFAMVDLVIHLEKQGGFRMSPGEVTLDNLDSLQKILDFVATKS